MNGQMMNYNKYLKSLKETPEPVIVRKIAINYKELIEYARKKGVQPCDLPDSEKEMFILN